MPTMEEKHKRESVGPERFARLFERLREELPEYEFKAEMAPFHSSYDNWHFFGRRKRKRGLAARKSSAASVARPGSSRSRSDFEDNDDVTEDGEEEKELWVVARVSRHALRLEREYKLAQALSRESDPEYKHFIRPILFARMPARQPGDVPLSVSIVEAPGQNYLRELVRFGPNFYSASLDSDVENEEHVQVSLLTFLDFAIGATECCELLHHGNEMVHGELRGDAFHYHRESGAVRLIDFGSGVRSFENGLTSAGWSSLMSERGVEHKLQFIAPEQTGRLPAEPDSRTDIYSLGILFWTMLTGRPAFDGSTPLEIMQNSLSRRIPSVTSLRPDVPDALSAVIHKMTHKSIDDRYNSVSGVKHDLQALKKILTDGDTEALTNFKVASNDMSCFFTLPTHLIGRIEHRKIITDTIEKAARRSAHAAPVTRKGLYSLSSGASITSSDRPDVMMLDEIMSDSTSSGDHDRYTRLNSVPEPRPFVVRTKQPSQGSLDSSEISVVGESELKPLEVKSSIESKGSMLSNGGVQRSISNYTLNNNEPSTNLRTAQKLKRKGKTEVISISGNAGFGKSALVQSIQSTARKHGYFTSAKFDQVSKSPFEPVMRVMSSLFRQIFSEENVNDRFHDNIRTFVRPFWGILHSYLELPEWLLATNNDGNGRGSHHAAALKNSSVPAWNGKKTCNAAATHEWLRYGGSNKTSRFMHIFMDVLRLLAVQKFICFCLDDLQFADQESLDLLQGIIAARIPIMLILTSRPTDTLAPKTRQLLRTATTVELGPFTDDDTAQYVSDTLHRQKEYCLPLAAVVQERTHGNPFFIREMMDSAYRKRCVYYCWRCTQWEFNLDRVFDEFSSPDGDKFCTNDFISRRMQELPVDTQALLAWASIMGTHFSYNLIRRVMACECSEASPKEFIPSTSKDPVAGLQLAIKSFIVMPTENEDWFKFSHDRYLAAAGSLCKRYREEEMHYVIACAMMKHEPYNPEVDPNKVLFDQARHVCEGIEALKLRQPTRAAQRDLLYQAAEVARETGARSVGLFFYKHCLDLLQDNPWDDSCEDASYGETLTLLTKAAEAYWYMGRFEEAGTCLNEIFNNARDASDRAPAHIIYSRMFAERGDSRKAFFSLRCALNDLGINMADMSWEECDEQFQSLFGPVTQTLGLDIKLTSRQPVNRELATLGALMVELLSASFWTNALLFYQCTLKLMDIYLKRGLFPQVGLGFVHYATICVYRFSLVRPGLDFGDRAVQIFESFNQESYTIGRGLTLRSLFLGHLQTEMKDQFQVLNRGLEAAVAAGDKILHLLNMGIIAAYRMWSSQDLQETEAYVQSVAEEFPEWAQDMRGGGFCMSVRQYARALQGKTQIKSASTILNDEHHNSETYTRFVCSQASNPERTLTIYKSYKLTCLFRYGYYREALALGNTMLHGMDEIWCMRYTYSDRFYMALSLVASVRDNPDGSDREQLLQQAAENRSRIEVVASVNPVNYAAWILLIDAEVDEVNERHGQSLLAYEAAIDHTVLHGFTLDEALSLEMYADFLVRRGAKRPARGIVKDCISAYRRVSAFGKADHVAEKFEFLLYGTTSQCDKDVGTQTSIIDTGNTSYKLEQNAIEHGNQSSVDRTQEWLDPASLSNASHSHQKDTPAAPSGGLSAVGLDMIDLASILESSQLLSSELNVDRLLTKLTEIIVESTGADRCGLVVEQEEGSWYVAATGAPEGMRCPPSGMPLDEVDDPVAKQVTSYVLRFKEPVFLRNVLEDERFANVPQSWLKKYPEGASMITLPILHGDDVLLGSVHCQAPPNTFTERTVTLLKLLVNQIAISIANALLFKRVEKVSASNSSMLEVQKQALNQARLAEAKAMEMVRQKEEAAKAKTMFLANVSHELRTPLNGVIGMSEMLKSTRLTKEQAEHADSIRICADTLLSVINDILDFSKLEAGKMQIFHVPLSLTETIKEVVRALSYTNFERGLETIEQLELDPKLIVMGDPVRLHQILFNILSNSYKFTSRGSVTVRAKLDFETKDDIQITVSIKDTGIGISDGQQKKLFLPFSQADASTARSYGGTGLGLSICKAIIENIMRGRIWLESTPGMGTTVFFTLPFKKVKSSGTGKQNRTTVTGREADPMAIFTSPTGDEGSGARAVMSLGHIPRDELKVCIAEDNPINQKIAINFVKKLGFRCEAFGDGQQAVDALSRASKEGKPFHLVLMDVQMPVLDGYDATREIRRHPDPAVRDILVIAMTASAIRGDREKCLEAGMNNYLAKPVRADTLKQMLESYLHQPTRSIPNLQDEANQVVDTVVSEEANENDENIAPVKRSPDRPKSARKNNTQIRLAVDEMVQKVQHQPESALQRRGDEGPAIPESK